MGKHISQAVRCALTAIESCQRSILDLHCIVRHINARNDKTLDNAIEIISSKLYRKMNDAYATLFMWGNVAPEEAQREARKKAFEHYLSKRQSIMQMLDINLDHPDQWLSKEDQEFRAEIEALKQEGEK